MTDTGGGGGGKRSRSPVPPSASSSSSSRWTARMEKKLSSLSETSSTESIQTVVNWICFHRFRKQDIVQTILELITNNKVLTHTKQVLFWKVLNGIVLYHETNPNYAVINTTTTGSGVGGGGSTSTSSQPPVSHQRMEQQLALRVAFGEALPTLLEQLGTSVPDDTLNNFLSEWEEQDVFDSPTLMADIRRVYNTRKTKTKSSSPPSATTATTTKASTEEEPTSPLDSSTVPTSSSSSSNTTTNIVSKKEEEEDDLYASLPSSPPPAAAQDVAEPGSSISKANRSKEDDARATATTDDTRTASPTAATAEVLVASPRPTTAGADSGLSTPKKGTTAVTVVEYDFEASGVPAGNVEPRQFIGPCQDIATLQIARDVRAGSAVERSSQLSNIPQDVWDICKSIENGSQTIDEIDDDKINELSKHIPDKLLDLDIDEELTSLETYRDIVERQTKARGTLIHLLLKSRCQFGARDAAKKFHTMSDPTILDQLKKRKQVLADALELEGADASQIEADETKLVSSFLSSSGDNNENGSAAKKRKTNNEVTNLPPFEWYSNEDD